MERIRKALAAGVGAAGAAIWAALVNGDRPATTEGWAALIGGAVALGILAGVATFAVRNTGPGINAVGSETKPAAVWPADDQGPFDVTGRRSDGYPPRGA